jgi:hypothetical protein
MFKSKVVAKDDTTLVVCDFIYDGKGPDAFFIVGSKNDPNPKDAKPGKSPFNRKKTFLSDPKTIPTLKILNQVKIWTILFSQTLICSFLK